MFLERLRTICLPRKFDVGTDFAGQGALLAGYGEGGEGMLTYVRNKLIEEKEVSQPYKREKNTMSWFGL